MQPTIPTTVKDRVEAKLVECIKIADKEYGLTFIMPDVIYTKRGRVAGTATPAQNLINLNPILLMENLDEMINDTLVHEFAHLVDSQVHPWINQGAKRDIHGTTWQSIMRVLGVEPTRCHTMDTTNSRKKTKKYTWVCKCGATMELGSKRHKRQLAASERTGNTYTNTKGGYWLRGHKKCGHFTFAVSTNSNAALAARAPVKQPKKVTKLSMCRNLFANNPELSRAQLIEAFIGAGCTQAGASTYYATIKKELKS